MPESQRARGRARITVSVIDGRRVAVVSLSDGAEIGFAIGAMNAVGLGIVAAQPREITVALGRRRVTAVAKALQGVGFSVRR